MRLTSLRGVASLIVLLHHAMLLFKVGPHDETLKIPLQFEDTHLLVQQLLLIPFNGQASVVLFFVLSGCVLSLSLRRGDALQPPMLAAFYVKRAFRILPTLWFAVLIGALMLPIAAGVHGISATSSTNRTYLTAPSPIEMLGHSIALFTSLNPPLWSLFIEIFYSAFLPLIFWATLTRQRLVWAFVIALTLLFAPLQHIRTLHYYAFAFLLGAVIANLLPRASREWRWAGLAIIGGFVVLLLTRRLIDPIGMPMSFSVFAESSAAAVLVYLVQSNARGSAWLEWRPIVFLGEISYSVYLLHVPLLFGIAALFKHLVGEPFIVANGVLSGLIVAVPTAVATIALATVTYRFLELPTQQLGRFVASTVVLGQKPRVSAG